MHKAPRTTPIDRIYLHTNEGPETANGAQGLVNYLARIDGGYHVVVDDKSAVRAANDDQVVYGAGGDNSHSLSICLIGYAGQSASDWADEYSKAELALAAKAVAYWCIAHNIPAVHVTGAAGQAPTARGIAEHADDHDPNSAGHTDPGPNFPLADFIARVANIIHPAVSKDQWKDVAHLVTYEKEMTAEPIRAGESGWKVVATKQLLAANNPKYDVGNESPVFGPRLVKALEEYKRDHKLKPVDGGIAGGQLVRSLFKTK